MKKLTAEIVIEEYIRVGEITRETDKSGDSKKANKEFNKLVRMFKLIEQDMELARTIYPVLFLHENYAVRIYAAAASVSLGLYAEEAKNIFEAEANSEDRLNAFNAKMTLDVWKNRGYLKVYPTQEIRMTKFPE